MLVGAFSKPLCMEVSPCVPACLLLCVIPLGAFSADTFIFSPLRTMDAPIFLTQG